MNTSGRNSGATGLIYPRDLAEWQRWQDSRRRLQRGKAAVVQAVSGAARAVRRSESSQKDSAEAAAPRFAVSTREGERAGSHVLIGIDSDSPTAKANSLSILPYLSGRVSVVHPVGLSFPEFEGEGWGTRELTDPVGELAGDGPTAAIGLGHFLGAGALVHEVALLSAAREYTLQHGALTPYAPPLPEGTTLLAWSEADAAFWSHLRDDVQTEVVGSQHLWQAAQQPHNGAIEERPVFLGQLHGAELPRRVSGGSAWHFCKGNNGLYRPHPREEDALSRAQHRVWQRRGMEFADASLPLSSMPNQVVAVFSTGVLEAAVRGIPSWVYAVREPLWVREFWERYDMRRWGNTEPTPAPDMIDAEPATAVAKVVEGAA